MILRTVAAILNSVAGNLHGYCDPVVFPSDTINSNNAGPSLSVPA
jgi:hypothetical protein